jgi:ABC-type multidrug transport system fused ATPase/permease subunit
MAAKPESQTAAAFPGTPRSVQEGQEEDAQRPAGFFRSLRVLWPLLAGYRWRAAGILALMFVAGLTEFVGLSMLVPLIGAAMGDLPEGSGLVGRVAAWIGGTRFGMLPAAGLMVAAMLVKNVLSVITVRRRMRLALELRNRWAERIFDGALRAPLATLSRQRTGELVEAVSSETQKAGNAVATLLEVLRRLILAAILLAGLLVTAPLLTLAVGTVIALTLLVLRGLRIFRSIDDGKAMLEHSREVANITAETMAHVRQIKLLDAYAERRKTLLDGLKNFARVRIRFETASQIPAAAIEMAIVVLAVGGLALGQLWAPDALRTALPMLALFVVVANRLVSTIGSLSNQTMKLNVGLANVGYVAQRLAREERGESLDSGEVFPGVSSCLELDRVRFAWPGGTPVLAGVSMRFPRGEVTAIIGASGRGKSTIAALLCGLLSPDGGAMLVDGSPLSRFTLRSVRQSIGYVTQEVELFHGTVEDNVRMGHPEATHDEVVLACRLAHAHDFISALPIGYRTEIGERGASLSGGQRQRLALARALLGRRSVYVFDEATSALDEETQSQIQETIDVLRKDAVVVVIAHRASAIRQADRVYRLEPGGGARLLSSPEDRLPLGHGAG